MSTQFLRRLSKGCKHKFLVTSKVSSISNINNNIIMFLPLLFGCEISSLESELFSLPVCRGGLGIYLPKHMNQLLYNTSRGGTVELDGFRSKRLPVTLC